MEPTYNVAPQQADNAGHTKAGRSKQKLVLVAVIATVFLAIVGVGVYAFFAMQPKDNEVAAAEVAINADGLNATTILVKKGTEITWINQDEQPHKIVSDNEGSGLDSGEALAHGDSYTYTFEEAGTFSYYDPLNVSGFKGIVIVQ
jgi:plastocyanin